MSGREFMDVAIPGIALSAFQQLMYRPFDVPASRGGDPIGECPPRACRGVVAAAVRNNNDLPNRVRQIADRSAKRTLLEQRPHHALDAGCLVPGENPDR